MAGKGKRGFAGMDPEKHRQIASKGGKAAHQKGTAHEFTPEEAREAGRRGGRRAHAKNKSPEQQQAPPPAPSSETPPQTQPQAPSSTLQPQIQQPAEG